MQLQAGYLDVGDTWCTSTNNVIITRTSSCSCCAEMLPTSPFRLSRQIYIQVWSIHIRSTAWSTAPSAQTSVHKKDRFIYTIEKGKIEFVKNYLQMSPLEAGPLEILDFLRNKNSPKEVHTVLGPKNKKCGMPIAL